MGAVIGEFPLQAMNHRTIKAPINPMDKCTIVSIFPKPIKQYNPTVQPGDFIIPAGSFENPSILVIGPSSWWKESGENQPLIEIPHSSPVMADSIIKDYIIGLIFCTVGVAQPGVFFVQGEKDIKKIKTEHALELNAAKLMQNKWFETLVAQADSLWARSNGNPLAVDDTMRLAAKELQLDKPWLAHFVKSSMENCKACGTLVNPAFPVCPNCKAIVNDEAAKKLNLKFTQ